MEKLSDLKPSQRAMKCDLALINLLKNQIKDDLKLGDNCDSVLQSLCYDCCVEYKEFAIKYVKEINKKNGNRWDVFNEMNSHVTKQSNKIHTILRGFSTNYSMFGDLKIRLSLNNIRETYCLKEFEFSLNKEKDEKRI